MDEAIGLLEAKGHHPGILIVCRENNPKRDLTAKMITRAISKLTTDRFVPDDQFIILNQWR